MSVLEPNSSVILTVDLAAIINTFAVVYFGRLTMRNGRDLRYLKTAVKGSKINGKDVEDTGGN